MFENTQDTRVIADYVGHANVNSTEIYNKKRIGEDFCGKAVPPVLRSSKDEIEKRQIDKK